MIIFGFFLGTILGSLSKALADRSLSGRSFWGRSACPKCKHVLGWLDLFPILSYILLGGECRYCKKAISLDYLLVEVGMGILVWYLFYQSFNNFQILNFLLDLSFKTFFITVLVTLFLTDLKAMLIPDRIILPAIRISIIFIIFQMLAQLTFQASLITIIKTTAEPFLYSAVSAVLISGFFMALIWITKGKGMGGGDVKLGAFMGLGLGFPNAFVALILAFLTGAIWGLRAIIFGKKRFGQHIAFGPFLVLGSLVALFWGREIVKWYLHLQI